LLNYMLKYKIPQIVTLTRIKGCGEEVEVWKQFAQTLFAQTFFSVLDGN